MMRTLTVRVDVTGKKVEGLTDRQLQRRLREAIKKVPGVGEVYVQSIDELHEPVPVAFAAGVSGEEELEAVDVTELLSSLDDTQFVPVNYKVTLTSGIKKVGDLPEGEGDG